LSDVYYDDTQEKWNSITFDSGNDYLLNATIHFSDGTIINEKATKGDINGDEQITSNDALSILQLVVTPDLITEENIAIADIDGDGEVTSYDALKVLQLVVGLE